MVFYSSRFNFNFLQWFILKIYLIQRYGNPQVIYTKILQKSIKKRRQDYIKAKFRSRAVGTSSNYILHVLIFGSLLLVFHKENHSSRKNHLLNFNFSFLFSVC